MKKFYTRRSINSISPSMHKKSNANNDSFEGNFREAIWPFLMIGQSFGVMPLSGVSSKSITKLHFKWKHILSLFSLFIAGVLSAYSLLLFWKTFTAQAGFSAFATLFFYGSNTYIFISFLALARKWPDLMRFWTDTEKELPTFRSSKYKRNFIFKIRAIAFTILSLALIEHSLCIVSTIHYTVWCEKDKEPFLALVNSDVPHLYTHAESISIFEAVCAKYISISATFVWNYLDVFIMVISVGLTTHFKLFNNELKQTKLEKMSKGYWAHRRIQYGKLCELVITVDKRITHLILASFSNNLFFTCKQLFQSLRPLPTTLRMVYFWYSLIFLIMRAAAVSFSVTGIHDETKKLIFILRAVPSHSWNIETKRFRNELTNDTIALSGMQFFYLTRKLILTVAGTIATYELVLMQFNVNYTSTATCNP